MASLDIRRLHALLNLAWRVVVHYAMWPFTRRAGIDRFRANYVHEGLPPTSPAHRTFGNEAGRCTTCGACDAVCPILRKREPAFFIGPMSFIIAGARAGPHLPDIKGSLEVLNGPICGGCRKCDACCPELIPIARIAAALAEELSIIEGARSAAALGSTPVRRALPGPKEA